MSNITVLPHVEPSSVVAPAPLADCSLAEQTERRYLAVVNPLVAEAWEQHSLETLVDVLAWTLARVVVGLDNGYVTGDILRRLGNYTCKLAEAKRAEAEAEEAKQHGHAPH